MRESHLRELIEDEFGGAMAAHVRSSHVLSAVGGEHTVESALAEGIAPRVIWLALCDDFGVPAERRLGRDEAAGRRPQR